MPSSFMSHSPDWVCNISLAGRGAGPCYDVSLSIQSYYFIDASGFWLGTKLGGHNILSRRGVGVIILR
jgi:hypothetical protein